MSNYTVQYFTVIFVIKTPISNEIPDLYVIFFQAGILEEMLEDTMETLDEDDMDEEVDDEVQKVLDELTTGKVILKFYYISDNKVLLPQVNLPFFLFFLRSCLGPLVYLLPKLLKLFGFPTFLVLAYLKRVVHT